MNRSTTRVGTGFLIAVILVAANLRATMTGVGPVLFAIEDDLQLSSTWGGLLTTLPLLTFAVTSPFVGRIAHRVGSSRLIATSLVALIIGTAVRSLPGTATLFAGTVVLAVAIACCNVVLPALIRREVPADRIAAVSGIYVTTMGLVAAVSSGIAVPMANALPGGWRSALAWGIVPAIGAAVVWIPRAARQANAEERPEPAASEPAVTSTPWRSGLAWQVALFMGLQSLCFFSMLAWLPSILSERGFSETGGGWMLFLYQALGLAATALTPRLTGGRADQRKLATGAALAIASGVALLLVDSWTIWIACLLFGIGGGVCLVLALAFQSQRANSSREAAALAGMAQGVGYAVAALGPVSLGLLHDQTDGWTIPLLLLATSCLLMAGMAFGAGRDRTLSTDRDLHPVVRANR